MIITKGDILLIELDQTGFGSEQAGTRPAVVVSNNIGNKFSPCVIVALITSRLDKSSLPTHVHIGSASFGLEKPSIILCEQLRTIDKARIKRPLGRLDSAAIAQVDYAIMTALQI